jgi:hypothetical protein
MSESIIAVCFFHSFAPFFAKATACKALQLYSTPDRTPACTERAGAGFGGQGPPTLKPPDRTGRLRRAKHFLICIFTYLHIDTLAFYQAIPANGQF